MGRPSGSKNKPGGIRRVTPDEIAMTTNVTDADEIQDLIRNEDEEELPVSRPESVVKEEQTPSPVALAAVVDDGRTYEEKLDVLEEHLTKLAHEERTEFYSEVAPLVNEEPGAFTFFGMLEDVSRRTYDKHGVLLSALVISKTIGIPGGGFFTLAKSFNIKVTGNGMPFWVDHVMQIYEVYKKV